MTGIEENYEKDLTEMEEEKTHCHQVKGDDLMNRNQSFKLLVIVSVVCLLFMITEIIGGIISHSLAILTDAAHMATDLISYLIAIISIRLGRKLATSKLTYGYHRAEILGAFLSIFLIWLVTGILVYEGVERIIHKSYDINTDIMLITSTIGIVFNLIMMAVLNFPQNTLCNLSAVVSHGHSHSSSGHEHDEEEDRMNKKKSDFKNINIRAASIHIIGDLIQSFAVFIAAVIIYLKPHLQIIDPIVTFFASILILATTYKIMRDILNVLMEGAPSKIKYHDVYELLKSVPNVKHVHSLHLWCLTIDRCAISVHVARDVTSSVSANDILQRCQTILRQFKEIQLCTIQVEDYDNEKIETCQDCLKIL
ncbi:hypothetical protein SNEBB_010648 [Seison nebaliae]|nr:hypothetical protein SNEBB_010648 [Seison nebaliae]